MMSVSTSGVHNLLRIASTFVLRLRLAADFEHSVLTFSPHVFQEFNVRRFVNAWRPIRGTNQEITNRTSRD